MSDHLPTAAIETLQQRAQLLAAVRRFFDERGYFEVETPLLSHDVCVDAWLDPFIVRDLGTAGGGDAMFLQTSPEFAMKRLLAADAEAIYQITRSFRRGEVGRLHNPEFTIVEWYQAGSTIAEQMDLVEQLVRSVVTHSSHRDMLSSHGVDPHGPLEQPIVRLTYDAAFEQFAGRRVLTATCDELAALAAQHRVAIPPQFPHDDRDGWLNLLLANIVEPQLKELRGVFLHDYPASQCALARVRSGRREQAITAAREGEAPAEPQARVDADHDSARREPRPRADVPAAGGDPPVAERFELYLDGIEICNGYQELTDAEELAARMRRQSELRRANGLSDLPTDSRLIAAMRAGLPECAGVALGFDRLALWALGGETIGDVVAFPFERA